MINPPQQFNAIKSLHVDLEMTLQPLSKLDTAKHIASMITSMNKHGTVSTVNNAALEYIHTKSDGIPLFTESLVYALLLNKMLIVDQKMCQLSNDAETKDTPIPQTMEDAVMSQVRSLTPEEQEVLKVASVANVVFNLFN